METEWWQGNVDYDGDTDFADLVALARNYQLQATWPGLRPPRPEPMSAIVATERSGQTLLSRENRPKPL